MADVGLAFLSAFLGVVFNKMASPGIVDFIRRQKSTEELLKKMERSLRSMNMVLEDAEEKEVMNPDVKMWIDDLKDVAYTAEDILDEIATVTLRRQLRADFKPVAGKVQNLISSTYLDPFVYRVEPKIQEVLVTLQDLTTQKDLMGLQLGVGGKQYPERLTTSYVVESDTFGRDEDKKKVIDLLLSSDAGGNEMCVIAIVGMGGIGKTTLAKLVYNESRVQQHFDLKIWFCVSEEFVMPNVEKSIIEAATSLPCPKFENPEQLQVTLKKNLNGKKFLLVLDDVWSEKPIHQEFLSQLLHYGTRGSKILVTTRNESVALAMKAIATHHLKLLPKDDCWSLFEKHAFRDGSSNANPEIKEIGTKIVKKCKGLPLAIKAIGDLLWSESSVERWTNILMSNLWDLSMEGTNILPALRLSYKYLPSYLKRCFAYCSIFPKDYIFKKDQLVLLWMAEGFLMQQSKIEITMEEVGNHYFDNLVSRSLFQQSLETNSSFVMHDLVNDLANFVTGQFGFTRLGGDNSKEIGKMTRYLSYFGGSLDNFKNIKEDLYNAKQLRTFLALDCQAGSKTKMPRAWCLKVLSLSGGRVTKLLDSISQMKHLRYLDFSFTDINRLPNSICILCNLQTLKLSYCRNLDRLPRDMWKLINLRHLEFDQINQLKEMPKKMGRLKCLQTLTKFVISKDDSGSSIGELGKLIHLRGKLLIQKLQNVRSVKDALDANLKDKSYLEELVLEWNPQKALGILESQRDVLQNLRPHENLKSLTIKYYGGKEFPDWILELPSLSKLKLIDCKYCYALLLIDFPILTHMKIIGCDNLQSLEGLRAPKLAFFILNNCESLRSIPGKMHLFLPSLRYLELINCPEVESFPEGGLPSNLKQIVIYRCKKLIANWKGWGLQILPSLEWLDIGGESENVESFPGELLLPTTLTNLKILSFAKLKSLDNEGFRHLTSLVQLVIWDCPKLEYLPEDGFPSSLHYLRMGDCPVLLKDLKSKKGKEWLKVARVREIFINGDHIQGNEWPAYYKSPHEPPYD
ncbi:hypothetical protein I3843_14G008500 [Carya illinoinensis]|nr:hypothetical protein I3843_14G008500 [Carya illinoinensis]